MATGKQQELPIQDVEELIAFYCKNVYPPSLRDLEAMLRRFKFDIIYCEPGTLPEPLTDHNLRQVWIPALDKSTIHRLLLREAVEVLLRLELAPQYRSLSADAQRKTARMIELRAERTRLIHTARETRRQISREAQRAIERIEAVRRDPRQVRNASVQPAAQTVEMLAEQLVEAEEHIERLSVELEDTDF